jgi:dolichyl-phosphate-mannose--protein O-mannosyl transferase
MGGPLLVTGFFLGLAIATNWSAVALAGLVALIVGGRIAMQWWRWRKTGADAEIRVGLRSAVGWSVLALLVVPVGIYFASYLHFFLTGHSWGDFVQLHRDMLAYHRGLGVVHDDSSPWWQWPLVARGVWYYVDKELGLVATVFGNGNPLLYWPMVVAVAWVAIDWWGRRPIAWLILVVGFFGQWLPWALSPRGTFVYHFLPVVPLGCLALAVIITGAWRDGGFRRGAAAIYVAAIIATFVFFYPIYTAIPLEPHQVDLRMWLPSWR